MLEVPVDGAREEKEGWDDNWEDFEDLGGILVKSEGPKEDTMYDKKTSLKVEVNLIRNFYFLLSCIAYYWGCILKLKKE